MKYDYYITGTIGEAYDWWTGTKGTTSTMVKNFLDSHKDQELNILVSSPGGYLDEGITIGELIAAHGNCNMYIVGMTASAATVLCMKAKTVNIATGSMMLIHNTSYVVSEWCSANKKGMDALIAKFQKQRNELDTFDKGIAAIYSHKNGKSLEENMAKMDEEKWMLPDDAKKFGLVDTIYDEEQTKAAAKNICFRAANKSGFAEHYGLPEIPGGKEDKPGFLQRMRSKLSGALAILDSVVPEDEPKNKEDNNSNTNMKKLVLNFICAALACQELTVSDDGKVTLTEEQLKTLENAIKADKDSITALTDAKKKAENAKTAAEKDKADAEKAQKTAEDKTAEVQKAFDDFKKEAGDDSKSHPKTSDSDTPKNAKELLDDVRDLL